MYNPELALHLSRLEKRVTDYTVLVHNAVKKLEKAVPAVSEADNGKVLTVVDGEWKPAESQGSSSIDLSNIPEVASIDNPTSTDPVAVRYDGEIYLKVEGDTDG